MRSIFKISFFPLLTTTVLLVLCGCVEEPVREDVPELITKVTLTFAPLDGGSPIIISASDPDGEGVQDIEADGEIVLNKDKSYSLSITLINQLADPTSPTYDITAEVEEEGDEHMFFFAWTNNLFSSPTGDGNMDDRNHKVDYQDSDGSLPIGLLTNWQTIATSGTGTFRIVLKHQPETKSATSSSADGETDLDLMFDIEVK
jgi:hypothetical protein